jgi:glucokinase-like ROK family protein
MTTRQDTLPSLNIRDNNLSEVLRMIHKNGKMSRAAISRETGLSATTISALANILLESGFVREVGEAQSSGGRPPILMEFEYEHRYAIGIDLGATHITTMVIDFRGNAISSRTANYNAMDDAQGAIKTIRRQIFEVLQAARIPIESVLGIGIGAPAPLEGEYLEKLSPVILPTWKDIDLRAEIRQQFGGLPIYIDNDANAGALAEKWWGRGQNYSNLAYIKLGTGVGSGLIINNEIFRGSAGTAGEIGHTTISPDGPLCRCGNHGCMESYVGTPAIIANAASKLKGNRSSSLKSGSILVRDVAAAAKNGDALSTQIVQDAGNYLGIAIANMLNLLNPGLIVLGGDLVAAGDVLLEAVRATALRRAIPKAGKEVVIMASDLGEDTVAIGAATLVLHHAFQPSRIAQILNV